jgi:protein-L-isoaspartate(D-aspartate) O-methyltransferase
MKYQPSGPGRGVIASKVAKRETTPMKLFPILIFIAGFFCGTVVGSTSAKEPSEIRQARDDMVREQIENRGIKDPRVLAAMREVPRHLFVPQNLRSKAYTDRPLPIGDGQTISQPYIVALMTEVLSLTATSRVLEIGTGSGYQAAVLAAVAGDVYTIEIKSKLYAQAARTLRALQLDMVKTRLGDGYYGWTDQAPFDAIMITAAVDHIPPPLLRQLKDGGRLVLPLGNPFSYQNLVLVTKHAEDYTVKQITGVLFVPLTGYALDRKR